VKDAEHDVGQRCLIRGLVMAAAGNRTAGLADDEKRHAPVVVLV